MTGGARSAAALTFRPLFPRAATAYALAALFVSAACAEQPDRGGACRAPGASEQVHLDHVIDGDTLELSDGRHVRLIGVNAPELAHRGRAAEQGAERARELARRFLRGGSLEMIVGEDARDRYDRTLAHVFRTDGRSLEEELVAAGLVRVVVIAPNVLLADCLVAVERRARAARTGLWNSAAFAPRSAADLGDQEGGFRLLRGVVTSVHRGRSNWWLELDRLVALEVSPADRGYFDWNALSALQGREIEARGWLVHRSSGSRRAPGQTPWKIRIGHPLMLQPLSDPAPARAAG